MQNLLSMQKWFIIASQKYAQHAKASMEMLLKHLPRDFQNIYGYVEYFPKTIYDFSWEEKSNRIIFYPMIGM